MECIAIRLSGRVVKKFAFGGPEQRLSHSRLPIALVLPAFLPCTLLAETGKGSSSSMLESTEANVDNVENISGMGSWLSDCDIWSC